MPKVNRIQLPQLTPMQEFKRRWQDCQCCRLCETRQHVVLSRGTYPCDILFVGEAPSIAADLVGVPFIGDIGNIMDEVIVKAGAECFSHAFTNIICCVPRNPEDSAKVTSPSKEAILACRPRLRGFITLCNPKLIVAVGYYARCALRAMQSKESFTAPVAEMAHPATVLYARPYGGYDFRGMVDALAKAVAEHLTRIL